jgi:hypothetical protein
MRRCNWPDPTTVARQVGVSVSTINRPYHNKDWQHAVSWKTIKKVADKSNVQPPPSLLPLPASNLHKEISSTALPVPPTALVKAVLTKRAEHDPGGPGSVEWMEMTHEEREIVLKFRELWSHERSRVVEFLEIELEFQRKKRQRTVTTPDIEKVD